MSKIWKYSLWRILGNDLPPRHSSTQTIENLKFILEHEPELAGVQKKFYLNRIVDPDVVSELKRMIADAHYEWEEAPFVHSEYRQKTMFHEKVMYLTNLNQARNACIKFGLQEARVVMPFDGASCFRLDGWAEFEVVSRLHMDTDGFFALGQWRVPRYCEFLDESILPDLTEKYSVRSRWEPNRLVEKTGSRELTIAFTEKHDQIFNEKLCYPCVDKVELLHRLGLHGLWDNWVKDMAEDIPEEAYSGFEVKKCGWVARLPSGNPASDVDNVRRGRDRMIGLKHLVEHADKMTR